MAWWDAMDRSTITLNGTNIARVRDKSGLGNDLVQNTAGNQPIWENGGISIANNSQFLQTVGNANVPIGASDRTIIYVYKTYPGRTNGDEFVFQWGNQAGPGGTWCAYFVNNQGGAGGGEPIVINGNTYGRVNGASYNANVSQIATCVTAGSNVYGNLNGKFMFSAGGVSNATAAAPLFLGRNSDGSRFFNGILMEAFIVNIAMTPRQVSLAEGSLGPKWGITLAPGHRYRQTPAKVAK